jgi:hypothetical protein
MDTLIMVTLSAAWMTLLGMIAWGVATSWRRVLQDDGERLPFFAVLERRGLAVESLERSSMPFYAAVRRCAMCRDRKRCSDWLAMRSSGPAPDCPNAEYLDLAARG